MALSRRAVLATGVLALASRRRAYARMGGIAKPVPTATVIDTLTLLSTSGSTVGANAIAPMFGLQFRKGDVPSGTYPQLQATDGTPWGVTFTNRRSWSDGSWKSCGVLPGPFPKSITTGGVTANVLNGGTAPAASGLTSAQMYAELIQCNLSGFAGALGTGLNLSGSWAAKLASDANNVEVVSYGDGQGGRLWRVLCHFQQSGTPHGQLECYFYVQQLLDSGGGLAGYRVLPRACQPWYNASSPVYLRGVQAFSLQYGSGPTTVTPPYSLSPNTISWNSGTSFTATGNNWYQGGSQTFGGDQILYGYFTTTGTLPAGLATNTLYPLNVIGEPPNQAFCGTFVTPTDGGSGVHTFNPCEVISQFGTLWGANAAGKYNFIQGAGSVASDAQVRVVFNAANRIATRCFPPLDLTLSPTPTANVGSYQGFTYSWSTQMIGPLYWHIGQPGERKDIGLLTTYHCRHLYNQTAVDELYVRMIGLSAAYMANCLRDVTTRGPVNLANPSNSYTGVPASLATTFLWDTQYAYVGGFTAPAGLNFGANLKGSVFFDTNEPHHQPHMAGYAYLVTGEPQYLDLEMEMACTMGGAGWQNTYDPFILPGRNTTLAAVNYYGVLTYTSDNEIRKMAWGVRPMIFAEGLWPDTDPAGTQIGTLLHDLRAAQFKFANAWLANSNSYLVGASMWVPLCSSHAWTLSYMTYVACLAAGLCEDAEAVTWLTSLVSWFNHVGSTFGYWHLHDYYLLPFAGTDTLPNTSTADGSPISSDGQVVFGCGVDGNGGPDLYGFSWTVGASPAFTWLYGSNYDATDFGFTPTNGDKVRITSYSAGAPPSGTPNTNVPGGFAVDTTYYAVNVSGNSFDLSATLGGSRIAPTGSNGNIQSANFGLVSAAPSSTGLFAGYVVADGYFSNFRGSMNYMSKLGIAGMTALKTDQDTRNASMLSHAGLTAGQFYQANPKYAMAA